MDRRLFLGSSAAFALALGSLSAVSAQAEEKATSDTNSSQSQNNAGTSADGKVVSLPPVDRKGGRSLMQCLMARRSDHMPGSGELTEQELGGLLFSALGVTSEDGKFVVPTALNKRKLALYAVLKDGVWQYLPEKHALQRVLMGDHRAKFDGSACILLYTAPSDEKFSAMHVGSMYQNAGLFCASAGLKNCVKYQKCRALDKDLPLPDGWETFISQSVAK
ncbi:MAG: SagB/ThcOx family dehydrogenase [Desulfovibrionaceae bacterium]|nr:SagB/ThcOx family dehydrogenase [Desulfovibrionaceae bacterium]